jgi:hypothetical protein
MTMMVAPGDLLRCLPLATEGRVSRQQSGGILDPWQKESM